MIPAPYFIDLVKEHSVDVRGREIQESSDADGVQTKVTGVVLVRWSEIQALARSSFHDNLAFVFGLIGLR